MRGRIVRLLPRLLWGASLAMLVAAPVLGYANRSIEKPDVFTSVVLLGMAGFATGGALFASRHPENPIGWLFCFIAFSLIFYGLREVYVVRGVLAEPGSLPAVTFIAWVGGLLALVALLSFPLTLLLFPDGKVPSSRWRPVVWAALAACVLVAVGVVLAPGKLGGFALSRIRIPNPTAVESLRTTANVLISVGALVMVGVTIASVVGLVLRFRRASGEERQQIRWLAYVGAMLLVVPLIGIASALAGVDAGNVVFPAFFLLLLAGIPAASGVAILKYRLFDLDLVIKKTVVFGILVVLLMGVAALLLLGLSLPFVQPNQDQPAALILTGAALGLAVIPLYRFAKRIADRVVYGGRATPYEVLTEFSDRLSEAYAMDDVMPRIAQILGQATGASVARVWLLVSDRFVPIASWPPGAPVRDPEPVEGGLLPSFAPAESPVEVRHQGELLGAFTVEMSANDPMTPGKERLARDLAGQAGLVLRNVRLIEELRASRRRIVSAQDDRAKALERNIHDGAQQQLVALSVKLRLAQGLVRKDPDRAEGMLSDLQTESQEALENLRDLARGIYPPLLADKGLVAALEAQARRAAVPVTIEVDGVGRYPREVESAVYFCTLEALNNVAKYARASGATLRLVQGDGHLRFEVRDDGQGYDPATTGYGTGLQGMADRLDAIGGALEVHSAPGGGTTVAGRVPARAIPSVT